MVKLFYGAVESTGMCIHTIYFNCQQEGSSIHSYYIPYHIFEQDNTKLLVIFEISRYLQNRWFSKSVILIFTVNDSQKVLCKYRCLYVHAYMCITSSIISVMKFDNLFAGYIRNTLLHTGTSALLRYHCRTTHILFRINYKYWEAHAPVI